MPHQAETNHQVEIVHAGYCLTKNGISTMLIQACYNNASLFTAIVSFFIEIFMIFLTGFIFY